MLHVDQGRQRSEKATNATTDISVPSTAASRSAPVSPQATLAFAAQSGAMRQTLSAWPVGIAGSVGSSLSAAVLPQMSKIASSVATALPSQDSLQDKLSVLSSKVSIIGRTGAVQLGRGAVSLASTARDALPPAVTNNFYVKCGVDTASYMHRIGRNLGDALVHGIQGQEIWDTKFKTNANTINIGGGLKNLPTYERSLMFLWIVEKHKGLADTPGAQLHILNSLFDNFHHLHSEGKFLCFARLAKPILNDYPELAKNLPKKFASIIDTISRDKVFYHLNFMLSEAARHGMSEQLLTSIFTTKQSRSQSESEASPISTDLSKSILHSVMLDSVVDTFPTTSSPVTYECHNPTFDMLSKLFHNQQHSKSESRPEKSADKSYNFDSEWEDLGNAPSPSLSAALHAIRINNDRDRPKAITDALAVIKKDEKFRDGRSSGLPGIKEFLEHVTIYSTGVDPTLTTELFRFHWFSSLHQQRHGKPMTCDDKTANFLMLNYVAKTGSELAYLSKLEQVCTVISRAGNVIKGQQARQVRDDMVLWINRLAGPMTQDGLIGLSQTTPRAKKIWPMIEEALCHLNNAADSDGDEKTTLRDIASETLALLQPEKTNQDRAAMLDQAGLKDPHGAPDKTDQIIIKKPNQGPSFFAVK